jgi:membrane fusion protein, copper/silver efflux system
MKMVKSVFLLLIGVLLGAVLIKYVAPDLLSPLPTESKQTDEVKPSYWVAPMNPDFKSDKPGKSPMGMDLIPVYADKPNGSASGPGTIRISPDVVNNLGVRTTNVMFDSLHSEIKTVGYVQYDEDELVHVHPRVEGWVEKLYIKASGDPVKRGQPLYTIYSPALVNAQEEYLIALKRNNERLIKAAENRLKALQLPVGVIRNLKKNGQVMQTVTFYAPKTGVITMLEIREGFFVKPGTSMMSIGVLENVWVQAEIFERQAAQVKVGMPVTMTLAYVPGREWLGKVDYIYPTLDSSTRTLRVRLRFNNKDKVLMPNMFAQVVIHSNNAKPTLFLPTEAIIRTGSMNRVVLALGDGAFKSVAVKLGRFTGSNIEILEGVSEGEAVVTSAQFLIDSESNKTSDFKRMNHDIAVVQNESVWTTAVIDSLMPAHRMASVSHQPIPQWQWPAMTMDFTVNSAVDITKLEQGKVMNININKTKSGNYEILAIKLDDEVEKVGNDDNSADVEGVINSVMAGHRMLNISRGPISKWNKAAATLDFIVDKQVDMSGLTKGMKVKFHFVIDNDSFVITEIKQRSNSKDVGGESL